MAGTGASMFFICLRTMTLSYISSYSTISFSLMSRGNFSLFFCPNLRAAFCLRFSRKMAVFALFCVGQSGADAQLGSPATVRETRLTHTSPPHIQILCNAQVAYRMVPRDARSCLTCSTICPRMTKTLMILSPLSTPTSRLLFRKSAVRPPLTRSRSRLQSHLMMGGCCLVMTSPPLKNYVLSLDTSTPCTAPPPTTVTVITAGTRVTSKTQLAVSRGMAWR
jgi:hypothetical protein